MGKKGSQLGAAIHKMFDMSQEKWFVSWQTKEVVRVEPDPLPSSRRDDGDTGAGTNTGSAELQRVEAAAAAAADVAASNNDAAVGSARPLSSSTSLGAPNSVGLRLFCFPWEGASPSVFEALSWQVRYRHPCLPPPLPSLTVSNTVFVIGLAHSFDNHLGVMLIDDMLSVPVDFPGFSLHRSLTLR